MTGLSFKSAVFSLVIFCFLSGSAVADTFTFQDDAFLNAESMDFTLSGPSFFIHSGFINGPNDLAICTQGTPCTVPSLDIPANSIQPGFSGGTVGGVTADILVGALTFSSFSFTAENVGDNSGPVTVTGDIAGYDFLPGTMEIGPQVFDLQISGSGTGTASGAGLPDAPFVVHGDQYKFSGTATTAPEPSSLLLLSSGLLGFAAIRRWHLLRRVNH